MGKAEPKTAPPKRSKPKEDGTLGWVGLMWRRGSWGERRPLEPGLKVASGKLRGELTGKLRLPKEAGCW